MERDLVLETSQRSGISPRRLFFIVHKENKSEAEFFHHEWLIDDSVSPEMEKYIFYFNARRNHGKA